MTAAAQKPAGIQARDLAFSGTGAIGEVWGASVAIPSTSIRVADSGAEFRHVASGRQFDLELAFEPRLLIALRQPFPKIVGGVIVRLAPEDSMPIDSLIQSEIAFEPLLGREEYTCDRQPPGGTSSGAGDKNAEVSADPSPR